MADQTTFELEAALQEALTEEAWAKVQQFPDAVIRPDGVCNTCGVTIERVSDYPTHIGWHRRLNVSIRAVGLAVTQMIKLFEEEAEGG